MSEWQPIETAPKDGTKVIGLEDGYAYTVWWADDGSGWDDGGWGERPKPTHWMPLREPSVTAPHKINV